MRYQFWFQPEPGYGDICLEEVWIQVPSERSGGLLKSVFPEPDIGDFPLHQAQLRQDRAGITYVECPSTTEPKVIGRINSGSSPNGDFVPPGVVGIGYVSPSYVSDLLIRQFRQTPLFRRCL